MRKPLLFYFSLFLLSSLLFSCNKTEQLNLDFGMDYFPLEVGKWITYQADSIIYDNTDSGTIVDTISFQIKEEIVDTLLDNENRLFYRIERSTRPDSNSTWVPKDVWAVINTGKQIERVEENLRFIKLLFPVQEGNIWDGNKFVDDNTIISVAGESIVIFKNWLYEYNQVGISENINGTSFDDLVVVSQANEENLIELRQSTETYARGVGLVSKEMLILDTQCIGQCEGQSWEQKAQKGFIFRMKVIDYN